MASSLRIRSGVETLLAANGVSQEVRGHLQSHGLTGVQARHYDGHDYMPEKCRRRFKSEPPRRSNIEPGVEADFEIVGCG